MIQDASSLTNEFLSTEWSSSNDVRVVATSRNIELQYLVKSFVKFLNSR